VSSDQLKTNLEHSTTAPTICFVIPYFGNWPFWFPFFLESCRANPTINWIFHTDCGIPADLPNNVRIVETTFESYCQRVSNSLGIAFRPSSPYKLCDLKPALGYIHRDELERFDFWAFGDIDLVYGNLRSYFTADRLSRYDLYSTHRRRISGHCCLLRNNRLMREAFMHAAHWQQLLSTQEHVAFDESAFSHLFIRYKNWPTWLSNLVKPLNRWTRRTENVEAFTTPYGRVPWIDGSHEFPAAWYWDHGQLTNDHDASMTFPYFHFMVWKQREWRENDAATRGDPMALAASRQWLISPEGFSER
jgi:hypothetical protein